jgi:hypothetical protein
VAGGVGCGDEISRRKYPKAKVQLDEYLKQLESGSVPKYLLVSDFLNIYFYRFSTKKWYEFKIPYFYNIYRSLRI